MSKGTIVALTITLTHVKPSRLLPLTTALGQFLQDAAQFHFYCLLVIKEQIFSFSQLWTAKFLRGSIKDETKWWGSEFQRKTVLPNCPTKWILKLVLAFLSKLLPSFFESFSPDKNRFKIEISFTLASFLMTIFRYWKSSACQREFFGFDICSSNSKSRSLHVVKSCSELNRLLKKTSHFGQPNV